MEPSKRRPSQEDPSVHRIDSNEPADPAARRLRAAPVPPKPAPTRAVRNDRSDRERAVEARRRAEELSPSPGRSGRRSESAAGAVGSSARRSSGEARHRIPAEPGPEARPRPRRPEADHAFDRDVPAPAPPRMSPVSAKSAIVALVVIAILGALTYIVVSGGGGDDDTAGTGGESPPVSAAKGEIVPTSEDGGESGPTTIPGLAPADSAFDGWSDPARSGQPWSSTVLGQLTFRGNPTRSYYGLGPVPKNPQIQWKKPDSGGLCSRSSVGGESKVWCGTGWTGQPSVWVNGDRTWVSFGAYDSNIHFLDATDGSDILSPFHMGDIIKGSVTVDPDGYPLLYSGSRADFHILGLDGDDGVPKDLWSMSANEVSPTRWNNDWDSSPLVIDDYLFQGGENGQWYVIKLNRARDTEGKVTIAPERVFNAPTWDEQLDRDLAGSGSRVNDVSVENSLAVVGNIVYFSNSGGLVQGWDISGLKEGRVPERVFRFWTGDDTDASIVADSDGMLYIAQERERASSEARNEEIGQLVKLDPTKPEDPVVWKINDSRGMWATPAIYGGVVVSPTDSGRIIGADQMTGEILWEKDLPGPTWSSPVIVDDVWIQGDCSGVLHGYDFSDPRKDPPELWNVQLEGCIESTPTVFQGQIFVGARGGAFYAIGDPQA